MDAFARKRHCVGGGIIWLRWEISWRWSCDMTIYGPAGHGVTFILEQFLWCLDFLLLCHSFCNGKADILTESFHLHFAFVMLS